MSKQSNNDHKNTSPNLSSKSETGASEFKSRSGIEINTIYGQKDWGNQDDLENLGHPGEYPYTRGIKSNMYRGRTWTMRQYAGYASPEESNRRFRYLLSQGQTGLSVAFDLPTQTGYDSDHPIALGEVGRAGVPISSLVDMELLFDKIPLDQVSTSMTINATAPILLALYIAVSKKQSIKLSKLKGTIQNDILKEYIARGTYIYPPKPSMRLITDIFHYCNTRIPNWNTISVSGYHMSEAGANAVQELAFTFSNAIAYVESAIQSGLDIDSFAPRMSFFFVAHNNFFEEIAKFRAARRIWAKITRERFGAQNPRSCMLRFHTQTAGVTLTAQQPDNNIARTTIQALAAILGGTQSLHVNSRDEALGLPTEESAQISLRTQQILAHESSITETVDPLGGSYYVESLTDRLEESTFEYIDEIDKMGGTLAAIEQGYQSKEIHESAFEHQRQVENNERVVVGLNKYTSNEPLIDKIQRIDPKYIDKQIERVKNLRSQRDNIRVKESLVHLENVAKSTNNTIPAIIECVEAFATVGEIADTLRSVYGEWDCAVHK